MKYFRNYIFHFLAIFIVLFLFAGTMANAEAPKKPQDFKAQLTDASNGTVSVKLTWMHNTEGTLPQLYVIYMAEGNTTDLTLFKKIGYEKVAYNDPLMSYLVNNLKTGEYSFYITAAVYDQNKLLESDPSDIFSIKIEQKDPKKLLKIVSKPPLKAVIGQKYVYQIQINTNANCLVKFKFENEPPVGMELTQNQNIMAIVWTPTEEGAFDVAIRAYLDCDEPIFDVQKFTIKVSKGNTGSEIKFVSKPITEAYVGQEYVYEAQAESPYNKCPLAYKWTIYSNSQNVAIEGNGNIIKWIPQTAGQYYCVVKAYLDCDETLFATQTFTIKVTGDNNPKACAVIKGIVTQEDGTNIPNGVITAWTVLNSNHEQPVFKVEIKDGAFNLPVPEGAYKVRVDGPGFNPVWFENTTDIKLAKVIDIKCNDEINITMTVRNIPEPKYYTASGTVTLEKDGSPVMCVVNFLPIQKNSNGNLLPKDNTNNGFYTKTDDKGNYIIKLPNNFDYKAQAIPDPNSGLLTQFYDKVDDPMTADIIVMEDNITGIDFVLKSALTYENGFGGTVINSDDPALPLKAQVLAYLVKTSDNNTTQKKFMRTAETDANGKFKFSNLIPGDYVVLSLPMDRKYVPGYYKVNDLVTQKWREATLITVGNDVLTDDFVCKHRVRKDFQGVSQLRGNIYNDGGFIKAKDAPQYGDPLSGVFVFILDNTGEFVDYSFTDNVGNFLITGIEAGSYDLYADKVGYSSYHQTVETDYSEKANVNMSFGMQEDNTTDVTDLQLNADVLSYPQPANSLLNIQFTGLTGKAQMRIFNSIGIEVFNNEFNTTEGLNNYQLALNRFAQGVYFVRIENEKIVRTLQFNVIR